MKAILSIINHVCAAIFSGYVFSVLWGWFVVSTFGLPAIGIAAAALGVILVGTYVAHQYVPLDEGQQSERKIRMWARPIAALTFGAIVKAFM